MTDQPIRQFDVLTADNLLTVFKDGDRKPEEVFARFSCPVRHSDVSRLIRILEARGEVIIERENMSLMGVVGFWWHLKGEPGNRH